MKAVGDEAICVPFRRYEDSEGTVLSLDLQLNMGYTEVVDSLASALNDKSEGHSISGDNLQLFKAAQHGGVWKPHSSAIAYTKWRAGGMEHSLRKMLTGGKDSGCPLFFEILPYTQTEASRPGVREVSVVHTTCATQSQTRLVR